MFRLFSCTYRNRRTRFALRLNLVCAILNILDLFLVFLQDVYSIPSGQISLDQLLKIDAQYTEKCNPSDRLKVLSVRPVVHTNVPRGFSVQAVSSSRLTREPPMLTREFPSRSKGSPISTKESTACSRGSPSSTRGFSGVKRGFPRCTWRVPPMRPGLPPVHQGSSPDASGASPSAPGEFPRCVRGFPLCTRGAPPMHLETPLFRPGAPRIAPGNQKTCTNVTFCCQPYNSQVVIPKVCRGEHTKGNFDERFYPEK